MPECIDKKENKNEVATYNIELDLCYAQVACPPCLKMATVSRRSVGSGVNTAEKGKGRRALGN